MLRVDSDGTGILLQPTGRILGRIIAPPGTDMNKLSPQYEADVDIGGRDAIGIGVMPDGTFVIDRLPPATYTVTILEMADVGNTEVGRGTVAVPPGAAVGAGDPAAAAMTGLDPAGAGPTPARTNGCAGPERARWYALLTHNPENRHP